MRSGNQNAGQKHTPRGTTDGRSVRAFAVKPAPPARPYAARGLDRSARPSRSGGRAANAYVEAFGAPKITARLRQPEASGAFFVRQLLFQR